MGIRVNAKVAFSLELKFIQTNALVPCIWQE
jgi:hypothetical protein